MVVHAGSINRDHVHMFLSIPPSLSVSRAVQYLKGRSSHKLLAEFASLRRRYWGQHLWARGYWVTSSGNVTDEVWMEYINSQTAPEPDDDFRVT
jgi:putative transposase